MDPEDFNPPDPDDDEGDGLTLSDSDMGDLGGEDQDDPPAMVPKARLDQEITKRTEAERREARLQGQIEALSTSAQTTGGNSGNGGNGADPPKVYSRAELRDLVNSGRMDQDQMDDILDEQRRSETRSIVQETVQTSLSTTKRTDTVEAQNAAYIEAKPELQVDGSDDRAKVQREFDAFVALGDDPKDPATQLKALRAAFGPVEDLKPLKAVPRQDTHMEISNGGGGGNPPKEDTSKAPKDLSADEKRYYADLIGKGIYPGWAAVHDEMKNADPRIRARAKVRG